VLAHVARKPVDGGADDCSRAAVPNAPGMFAFADPEHVTEVLTAAGWAPPRFEKLDLDLDIAAGRGLEEAVVQSTQIDAVNSWLRTQPVEVVSAVVASLRDALAPYAAGASVRLPGAMWLIRRACLNERRL